MYISRIFIFSLLTIAFASCQAPAPEAEKASESTVPTEQKTSSTPLERGNRITFEAQGALLGQVSQAIQQGGPQYAIGYCSLKANPILDSVAKKEKVSIQRLALRHRNPNNYLKTPEDSAVYLSFEKALAAGQPAPAILKTTAEGRYFYKPIVMGMEACLKCHGSPKKQINAATLGAIAKVYPNDKAVNFALGDLRGMWKIELD
jgi:hypothetical protein